MASVYATGETVYDIIFRNDHPVAAKPGGSMLNSAVSMGRAGIPVSFIGQCGDDKTGDIICSFLKDNNVDTKFMRRYSGQSTIALAFLDKYNNASYSFYKTSAPGTDYPSPPFTGEDFVIFGSYYSISDESHEKIAKLSEKAKNAGSLLIYDPNFRKPHLSELDKLVSRIEKNIRTSDIVRGSSEDFQLIFGTTNAADTWNLDVFKNCKALIYTSAEKNVHLCTPGYMHQYSVPRINPISTIGAGDAFNAGIIYAMIKNNFVPENSNPCQWKNLIETGINFSANVCLSYENYISGSFARKLAQNH